MEPAEIIAILEHDNARLAHALTDAINTIEALRLRIRELTTMLDEAVADQGVGL